MVSCNFEIDSQAAFLNEERYGYLDISDSTHRKLAINEAEKIGIQQLCQWRINQLEKDVACSVAGCPLNCGTYFGY